MSSPALDRSGGVYRPPTQRKPSSTLGKPSPNAKPGTRTPRAPSTRVNAPPTPVTPSPFKARSRPASATGKPGTPIARSASAASASASGTVTPDESAAEPGTDAGAISPEGHEAPISLAASTDTLVDSKEVKEKETSEVPEIKEIPEIKNDTPAVNVEAVEVKLEDSPPPTVEPEVKEQTSSQSDDKNTEESPATVKDADTTKTDEPAAPKETEEAAEPKTPVVEEALEAPPAPAAEKKDVVPITSTEPAPVQEAQDSAMGVATGPQTPVSNLLTAAALTSSNKDWSERDDDASSVAGSVAASTSGRSTKGSKEKKEKKTKEVPKGGIQLGNHVIHPRKPGEPVPEWTPQQAAQPVKPKERDENKTAEILKRLHALEGSKPPTSRKASASNVNGAAEPAAPAGPSQAEIQAKIETQYKELLSKVDGKFAEHQSKLESHLAAQRNKLEAQLLNQQAKFDSQQSKLDAQLAAQDRKVDMRMGEQNTSLQAAMETFMTVEARAAEQASHQDAWASRIEDEQDGLEARLAALRGEVSRVGPMIAASESAVDERVTSLTNDVNNRLASATSATQAFEQRLEGRLKSQESDVGRSISKIASLENRMKEFAAFEARLADQQKALDAQLLVAAKLEGRLGEIDQLANKVKAVQASLDDQVARNASLEETLKKQQALIEATAKEQEQLEIRLSIVSKREEQATSTVGALQYRVNELERRARTSAAREGPLLAGAITRLVLARFEPKRLAACDPSKVINLARSTLLPDAKGRVLSKHYAKETQPIFSEHHLRSLFANATPGAILSDGAVLSMAIEAARTAADAAHDEEEKAADCSFELSQASEAAVHPGADRDATEQRLLAAHEALQVAQEKRMLAVQERDRAENLVKIVLACCKDVERAWSAVEDPTEEEKKKYDEFLPRVESVELELALRDDTASEYVQV